MAETDYKKKLIEVAIPLEAINAASAREKSIRHGHPSTLHLWWARRPLAACRAVLFAQLVDDPSSHPDKFPTEEAIEAERKRLFQIIEELVKWENSTNETVLERARAEIRKSCDGELPPIYDPFSGGGSIPLEAQRLGLPVFGSDLNPVAVMIGKAMIEIPPKFKDQEPNHPGGKERNHYRNAEGLAEDIKYYGKWMREEALERIGHLYPEIDLPEQYGGKKATVIAWIWSRTVPSPDPAFHNAQVPIASSFLLGSKKGREAWIEPIVDKGAKTIRYQIKTGGNKVAWDKAKAGTKAGRGANFTCLFSGTAITPEYIRSHAQRGELGQQLIAIVAEGMNRRAYISPSNIQVEAAQRAESTYRPSIVFEPNALGFRVGNYGMKSFGDMFTERQLLALSTFQDLLGSVKHKISEDLKSCGKDEGFQEEYSKAVLVYLAFVIDKCADYWSSLCSWHTSGEKMRNTFGRQALPMVWDFAEANPFCSSSGNWTAMLDWVWKVVSALYARNLGSITQHDAQTVNYPRNSVVSTDPPYYDNIGYADLSDFFYSWLKPSLGAFYPDLFGSIATPKIEELVATPVRHGGRQSAEEYFLSGMRSALRNISDQVGSDVPTTIYYAFKQSEIEAEGISSTGWATFVQAMLDAGFQVMGTWPMRTELANRMRGQSSNALANSVVLVCRLRGNDAGAITRAEFVRALKRELPPAITKLQAANVSPADMPQSAIGPGMGVFSRYQAVLEADDTPMTVKAALQLINRELDEFLSDIQGEFDADTRFAITWFEHNGFDKGEFGVANSIAQARGISVDSVKHAGIVESSAGKVRILKRDELLDDWEPATDSHLTIWECCQYLVRALENEGEEAAALLIKKLGSDKAEAVKDLAYCLYDICSNKRSDAKEATAYNALIAVWTDLTRMTATIHDVRGDGQTSLDL